MRTPRQNRDRSQRDRQRALQARLRRALDTSGVVGSLRRLLDSTAMMVDASQALLRPYVFWRVRFGDPGGPAEAMVAVDRKRNQEILEGDQRKMHADWLLAQARAAYPSRTIVDLISCETSAEQKRVLAYHE